MIPHYVIFWAMLVLTCGYALWQGRSDERAAALACLLATAATHMVVSPLHARYSQVEAGLLAIDLAMLATFMTIALRSRRFWPLWVAGLQLTTSMSHLMKAVDLQLLPQAYAAAVALWSYPILIILAVATWRGHRAESRAAAA